MRSYLSNRRFIGILTAALTTSALAVAATRLGGDLFSFSSSDKEPLGTVHRTDLLQQVTVAGTVIPLRRTMFTPPYSAYVNKLYVTLGQSIKSGAPVVTLTQTPLGKNEDMHPLRAPFDGTVVQVLHQEGEYIDTSKEGTGIVRVDDLNRLFIVSDVPESDIEKIRTGQQVLIRANAVLTRPYHGIIQEIALAAKEKKEWSRSGDRVEFEVKIEVSDKDPQLRPGMSCTVDIITGKREKVLALPHEFIEKEDEKYFVTLENGEKRQVAVGMQNESLFEITKGLKENDRVRMVDFFNFPKD